MHETLNEFLNQRPFKAFEIRLSNGDHYPVKHPDAAILMKTKIVLVVPDTNEHLICFLLHIAAVKIL
jgi:hypothetical protein